jgi:hypothetical protein
MRARHRLKIKSSPADAIGKERIQFLCQLIQPVSSLPGDKERSALAAEPPFELRALASPGASERGYRFL